MASDPVQALLDAGAIPSTPFEANSRYYGISLGLLPTASGTPIAYVLRRFIPQMRDIPLSAEHIVHSGERPDLLAAERLGDPELYWRIADANGVIDPFDLTDTIGLRVKIPAPSGQ